MEKEKTKAVAKTDKKNSQLIDLETAVDVVEKFGDANSLKRHEKYFLLRGLGQSTPDAAKALGYKTKRGYDLNYQFKHKPIWRERFSKIVESMPDIYKAACKMQLLNIAEVERKALEKYAEDPELAINKPQLLKHMKQTAGVIGDDFSPAQPQIPINQIQILIQQGMEASSKPSKDRDPIRVLDSTKD
jgi:hypothetical protein